LPARGRTIAFRSVSRRSARAGVPGAPPGRRSGIVGFVTVCACTFDHAARIGRPRAMALAAQRRLPRIPEADALGEQGFAIFGQKQDSRPTP